MTLNRILILGILFQILSNIIYAQIDTNDLSVIEKLDVKECIIGNKYKTISTKNLGKVTSLDFELISSKIENDSITISFVLWYCPYFDQDDITKHDRNCQCKDRHFDCKLVTVKQECESRVYEKWKDGVYKVRNSIINRFCVNEKCKIKLKKDYVYNLVFKLDKENSLYIKIN